MKIVYLLEPLVLKPQAGTAAEISVDTFAVDDTFTGVLMIPQLDQYIDVEKWPHAVQSFLTEGASINALANHIDEPYFLDLRAH